MLGVLRDRRRVEELFPEGDLRDQWTIEDLTGAHDAADDRSGDAVAG